MEAIILAGGLGTRLKNVSKRMPKSMALIQGKPFLEYQMDLLISQGVKKFVLSIGYKSEQIQSHFKENYKGCEIQYAIEKELLGTGGAIKNAMRFTSDENVIVANGDSLVVTNLQAQLEFHLEHEADVTLALKEMKDFERYGTVKLDENARIIDFIEKQPISAGIINAGLYIFNVKSYRQQNWPQKFSVEKDYFESCVNEQKMLGFMTKAYFLDIGIPSDFEKAQTEIGSFFKIDKSWTLFLDRDGVINKKRDNDYVKTLDELEFLPGALEAISKLNKYFHKTVIVTNQQGIGKGLMTEEALEIVHQKVVSSIEEKGGKIDAVYYAPDLASPNNKLRKPNIGMAEKAKEDFPGIDFTKSIMIGDSTSDMEFGTNAGMVNVFISDTENEDHYTCTSLVQFETLLSSVLGAK
ncbi:HAD-IIIA family hydrolase [Brumimicrobium oceani]|uniref:Histidinol phosphate phosphatase n=1 Tax=Brumimicrobium oceani TaxID=2100725 RepID=A0A2U2XEM9_9FLAO|nr:HAD-IIIA family hydrolase [Brumimicrobium oceani]PWH86259.1 histidinol phosphate phosphatase [Brumimicrobium oceani]